MIQMGINSVVVPPSPFEIIFPILIYYGVIAIPYVLLYYYGQNQNQYIVGNLYYDFFASLTKRPRIFYFMMLLNTICAFSAYFLSALAEWHYEVVILQGEFHYSFASVIEGPLNLLVFPFIALFIWPLGCFANLSNASIVGDIANPEWQTLANLYAVAGIIPLIIAWGTLLIMLLIFRYRRKK